MNSESGRIRRNSSISTLSCHFEGGLQADRRNLRPARSSLSITLGGIYNPVQLFSTECIQPRRGGLSVVRSFWTNESFEERPAFLQTVRPYGAVYVGLFEGPRFLRVGKVSKRLEGLKVVITLPRNDSAWLIYALILMRVHGSAKISKEVFKPTEEIFAPEIKEQGNFLMRLWPDRRIVC